MRVTQGAEIIPKNDTKPEARAKGDTPLGGGLYRDDRGKGKSYVYRGRVNGRTVRKVLLRPETGVVATANNTTVTEARRFIAELKGDAAAGGSKHFAHVKAKARPGDHTVAQAWASYMEKEGSTRRKRTSDRKAANYRRFIEPAWHHRTVRSISTADCKALIGKVVAEFEARGENGTPANKLHSDLNTFFNWCLTRYELKVEGNPMFDRNAGKTIPTPVKEVPKPARDLEEWELVLFFRAARKYVSTPLPEKALRRSAKALETRCRAVEATEFALRSVCRRDENFTARWHWMQPDGLLVPASVAKMNQSILVPLLPQMLALIGERPADAKDGDLIFGAHSRWLQKALEGIRPIMTLIARKERGFTGDFDDDEDKAHFTLHCFRDTFFTLMDEPRNEWDQPIFSAETRNACLNHRPGDVGERRYNGRRQDPRWKYAQRKGAVAFWNTWLDRLKAEALSAVPHPDV